MYECRIGSTLGHLSVSDREITVLSFFRSHLLPLQYSLIRAILGNMSQTLDNYLNWFNLIVQSYIHHEVLENNFKVDCRVETLFLHKTIFGFLNGMISKSSYVFIHFLLLIDNWHYKNKHFYIFYSICVPCGSKKRYCYLHLKKN